MNPDFRQDHDSEELARLRQRVSELEYELRAVRSEPLWASFERSPFPVLTVVENQIVSANTAALKLLGAVSSEQVVGRDVFDFVVPAFHQSFSARAFTESDQETPFVEKQFVRLDGKTVDVQVASFGFQYEGRSARRISFADISERKRTEERLRSHDQRFHELADNINQVLAIVDPKMTQVLYVSPAYEAIWQRSCESLHDHPKSWMDSVHPEDVVRVVKAAENLETFREEYRILRPSGEIRWIRARTSPVFEDGKLMRVVAMFEDVSDWKRMEQQLVQSQKMDAVGRLAGGIAHDFNNLLTVINGYSALLGERQDLPKDMAADLSSIHRAGERATALTGQLLAFSRKQSMQPKNIDLNATVKDVEPMLRRLIREDVELDSVLKSEVLPVKADPNQIEQVLMNLVINARDAIEGKGTITIETAEVEFEQDTALLHGVQVAGKFAMIAVSDTGKGMSAETQQRIFEPFFTTKEAGKGTGLGLATVYGIVKQSGGSIWVYSELGTGTVFKVYLPLTQSAAITEAKPQERAVSRGSGVVLVVEDDEQVRRMTASYLRSRGYTILEASDGEEALRVAKQHSGPIRLVITDVIMPKMGGPELADKLSSLYPETKILYVSGYTENAVIHATPMQSGMQHLSKPFTPDALGRKVSQILEMPKTMRA